MRFLMSLLALAPAVMADVTIPWTNCGKAGDLLTVTSVTGNVWPPKKGAEFDVTFAGSLSKDISGGNYHLKAAFDTIPILDKTGTLASLNVTLPIKGGPINIKQGLTFPSSVPSGSFDITVSATDEANSEIACAEIKVTLSAEAPTFDSYSDVQIIDPETAAARVAASPVPIPYTSCGTSSDLLTISSATANVWPPQKGAEFDVVFNGTLSKDVTGGNYHVKASFDTIPVLDKTGTLASLPNITFPIKAGPVNIAQGLTFPTGVPTGTYGITVSATDANNAEIGCVNLNVKLGATAPTTTVVESQNDFHPVQQLINYLPGLANTPVSFTSCGASSDLATVNSISADIWPPQKGKTLTLFIDAVAKQEIDAGNYDAAISWDGIKIDDEKGTLASLGINMPIPAGNVIAKKAFTIPAAAPSGSINVKATAADANNNELFCVSINTSI